MAKKIWKASQITVDPQREHNQDIIGLLQVLPQLNANIEGTLVAALLWAIWNARNKWLFEGKKENSTRAVARAESVIESFRKVKQPETNYVASQRAGEQKQWCPPPRDWLKINVDTAVDAEKQVTGLGVVIRDSDGKCKAAAVKTSKFFGSVVMAEAAAMEWGLQVASSIGVTNGVVESDSLEVVELVNKKSTNMSEVFWVISEILEKQKTFQNFKAQHVLRTWNGIAHALAKLALQRNETVIWLDELPTDIMFFLSN